MPPWAALSPALALAARPSLCALEALREIVCGATMTAPGGACALRKASRNTPVGGPPVSLIRSELSLNRGSDPSAHLRTARQTHLCEVAALGVGLAPPPVLPTSSELCSSPSTSAPLSAPTLPTASHQRACRGSRWPQECRPCARLRDRRRKS